MGVTVQQGSGSPLSVCAAGGTRYSTDWMHGLGAMVFLYQFSDPAAPHYYPQGGNEAGAYLQFIVDYYECLPTVRWPASTGQHVCVHQSQGSHGLDC